MPAEGWFRWFFVAAHIVVPAIVGWIAVAHVWWCLRLSWEFIALITAGLLPFLLPLIGVYVGKMYGLEMNNISGVVRTDDVSSTRGPASQSTPTPGATSPHTLPRADVSPGPSPVQQGGPIRVFPNLRALTPDELKILRTLWKFQSEYIRNGQPGLWGFSVGPGAADYQQFVRGFSDLAQRGLVLQDPRGLVFLTQAGVDYCRSYTEELLAGGDAWTKFAPAA